MRFIRSFFLIAILFSSLNGAAQNINNYLSNHAIDISNGFLEDKEELDSTFYNNQLFILGEIHGIQKGQDVDYDVLTLLNRKVNLTTYVAEIDFAKAYFINKYLQTGNENLLDDVFQDWVAQNAQWGNKDFKEKIRRIRSFNQKLKPNQRIHFEGIDQIQSPILVARYLKEKLRGVSKIKYSFTPLIDALEANNDSLIVITSTKLKTEAAGLNDDLAFALKNCMVIKSSREATLHDNFADLFKMRKWKNEKLYAFLGFAHIIQAKGNQGKFTSFAVRVEQDETLRLKGKILSLAILYVDSKMMIPNSAIPEAWKEKDEIFSTVTQFNHDGPLVKLDGIEDLKNVTKQNTTTLFNLSAEGSPYLNKKLDITYGDMMPKGQRLLLDEKGKATTDYFQYIVLVRNSQATTPIKTL